jgi:hypothetical protein
MGLERIASVLQGEPSHTHTHTHTTRPSSTPSQVPTEISFSFTVA